jgi:toxin secretion/phage lysis holin
MKDDVLIALKCIGAFVGFVWGAMHPLLQSLVILMGLDVVSGLLAGYVTQKISSDVSYRGMAKKGLVLVLIGAANVVTRHWSLGFELGAVVAGFYIVHEMVSITENAVRAGLPLPTQLVQALEKVKGDKA